MTPNHNIRNRNWFQIQYAQAAPNGYPPILQAERIIRYTDATGIWVVALWEHQPLDNCDDAPTVTCLLRIADKYVVSITRHETQEEATNCLLFG